eukprot:126080_1
MSQETQFEITDPPSDGISNVQWFNHSNHLVATSWDKSVSLYHIYDGNRDELEANDDENKQQRHHVSRNELKHRYQHDAGVLDCSISSDDLTIFSVGCDNRLYSFDVKSRRKPSIIGQHAQAIRCVEFCNSGNMIITGSWDKSIKIWDINSSKCTSTHALPDKVFAMSCVDSMYRLVVGIAGRQVWIYDVRNMKEPQQKRESSLKHQTRNIVCHPSGEQYVVSSIEGRVAVEYFNAEQETQSKKYAFKCYRVTDKTSGMQTIYPVNAITFHPVWKTFATGGGDGVVNIWDGMNKKRICQFPPYNTSIASLAFNNNGSLIAIASSYTWEQGDKPRPNDAIWIRKIKESESKPKIKSKVAKQ